MEKFRINEKFIFFVAEEDFCGNPEKGA